MRVLVLGGTAEARAVLARLVERGDAVVSSLAGRVCSRSFLTTGRQQLDALTGPVSP